MLHSRTFWEGLWRIKALTCVVVANCDQDWDVWTEITKDLASITTAHGDFLKPHKLLWSELPGHFNHSFFHLLVLPEEDGKFVKKRLHAQHGNLLDISPPKHPSRFTLCPHLGAHQGQRFDSLGDPTKQKDIVNSLHHRSRRIIPYFLVPDA